MDLSKITKVAHTDRQEDVNRLLEEGWILLASEGGKDDEGNPVFWHALGFPGRPAIE